MEPLEVLRRTTFLAEATPTGLSRLAGCSTWRHLTRGEFLFHIGEPVSRLYVIATGRVAAAVTSSQGTPLLFHVAAAGEAAGQVDLLHGGSHTASAQALTAVRALAIPRRACVDLLEAEPAVLLRHARHLASIVSALTDTMGDLVFLDLERRLARVLAEASVDGKLIDLRMTQSELAARLGVTRQSVNRALVKLASRGLIVMESGRPVRLLDPDVLAAFVASGSR